MVRFLGVTPVGVDTRTMSWTTRTCGVHARTSSHARTLPAIRFGCETYGREPPIGREATRMRPTNHVHSPLERSRVGRMSTPEPDPIRRTRGCCQGVRCCVGVATESRLRCGGSRSVDVAAAAQQEEETNWNENKQLEQVNGTLYFYFKRVIGQFRTKPSKASNTLLRADQRNKSPNAGGIIHDSRHCRDRLRPCPSLLLPPRSLPFSSLATKAE